MQRTFQRRAGVHPRVAWTHTSNATPLCSISSVACQRHMLCTSGSALAKWRELVRNSCAIMAVKCSSAIVAARSEEHTSELQSLMRISYAVFCLKKKKQEL